MTVFVVLMVAVATIGFGGNVWLLAQESDDRHRAARRNTRVLQWLARVSTIVVLVTLIFARPWYWDLALGVIVILGITVVHASLQELWHRPRPRRWGSVTLSAAAVFCGVVLLTLAGVSAVLDGAVLANGGPEPTYHGGAVLSKPVLYQLFWGAIWNEGPRPTVNEAVMFEHGLPRSTWGAAIRSSGFGVTSITSGGCWIDASPPPHPGEPANSLASGPLPMEIHAAFSGQHHLTPCPGSTAGPLSTRLPDDALVAVWLPPDVPFQLGGVAAHGAVTWPGRPQGLAVAGLPGSYADWGLPACAHQSACRGLPGNASPTYALSHEVVETITNPYGQGWFSRAPLAWTARYVLKHGPLSFFGVPLIYPGEVADLCEPGAPSDRGQVLADRFDPGGPLLAVSPFFRPGSGCVG